MGEKWQHSQESKPRVIQKEMSKGINTLLINMSDREKLFENYQDAKAIFFYFI